MWRVSLGYTGSVPTATSTICATHAICWGGTVWSIPFSEWSPIARSKHRGIRGGMGLSSIYHRIGIGNAGGVRVPSRLQSRELITVANSRSCISFKYRVIKHHTLVHHYTHKVQDYNYIKSLHKHIILLLQLKLSQPNLPPQENYSKSQF